MQFTERIRVSEFARRLGVTPAQVLEACREHGLAVAAPGSVLDPRECERLVELLRPRSESRPSRTARWAVIRHKYNNNEIVTGQVSEVVKGGLTVDIGVRAFLPGSLADIGRLPDLGDLVGQEISARIIRFEPERSNVVLSRRAVLEEQAAQLWTELKPGQRRQAIVRNVKHNGIVVNLGGIQSWVPQAELALPQGESTTSKFTEGDRVIVTVCDVAADELVVSLRRNDDERKARDLTARVDDIARDCGFELSVDSGVVVLDVQQPLGENATTTIQPCIHELRRHGFPELLVRVTRNHRHDLRRVLRSRELRGVDPDLSRQRPDGFLLRLTPQGEAE